MYLTEDIVSFTVDEFRRGLEGLSADEAHWRSPKSDGSQMNAVAWTVQHIAAHWHNAALAAQGMPFERRQPPTDGSPPDYLLALSFLETAASELQESLRVPPENMTRQLRASSEETAGSFLARAIFHSWFHAGEINAVRQLLGHPEIRYVADPGERLRWQ